MFPVFAGFRGGKAVATSAGVFHTLYTGSVVEKLNMEKAILLALILKKQNKILIF